MNSLQEFLFLNLPRETLSPISSATRPLYVLQNLYTYRLMATSTSTGNFPLKKLDSNSRNDGTKMSAVPSTTSLSKNSSDNLFYCCNSSEKAERFKYWQFGETGQ